MNQIKYGIAVCFVLLTLAGCKNDKQAEPENVKTAEPAIQVVVDMVVKKDDVFQLFYTEGQTLNFGPQSIYINVPGKNESQQIVFDLPNDAVVGNLRLDPGQNQQQEEMTINGFTIKMGDKELVLSAADFFKYFSPNNCVKINPEKFSFTGLKADGIYDPLFYGNYYCMEALKKLNQ